MAKKEKKAKKKVKGLWQEFKDFINKGNAFMLAVGVVIGGAFGAIVTAIVNILLSLCTAALPGGLAGLITVIHTPTATGALADVQKTFPAAQMELTVDQYLDIFKDNAALGSTIYTKYGGRYVFATAPVLNWGALINAVISFIIIAIVLFIIVKVVSVAAAKKAALEEKAREEYYKKHPEERPVPPEPGVPEPTEVELLKEIRDALVQKEAK